MNPGSSISVFNELISPRTVVFISSRRDFIPKKDSLFRDPFWWLFLGFEVGLTPVLPCFGSLGFLSLADLAGALDVFVDTVP